MTRAAAVCAASGLAEGRISDRQKTGGLKKSKKGGGVRWRTKTSFFSGGEEFQGFLEVLDGRVDVLVLQRAARVLAVLLRLGEVFRGELEAAWREETNQREGSKRPASN